MTKAPTFWRIRSGAQTGVDRAALDAAVALGLSYAGWVPKGGWAEDFPEPPGLLTRYPALKETAEADPAARTAANIRDAAATLVLPPRAVFAASPGTRLTVDTAQALSKPLLILALDDALSPAKAQNFLRRLTKSAPSQSLDVNIAGPRESEAPGVYDAARAFLADLFRSLGAV